MTSDTTIVCTCGSGRPPQECHEMPPRLAFAAFFPWLRPEPGFDEIIEAALGSDWEWFLDAPERYADASVRPGSARTATDSTASGRDSRRSSQTASGGTSSREPGRFRATRSPGARGMTVLIAVSDPG
jgi:hypothetical protein